MIARLRDGRLHLQHGPIDVVLRAWGAPDAIRAAEDAAARRFPAILPELCEELRELRRPMAEAPRVTGPVARRMVAACASFAPVFVTPMAAVAGAVADELLSVMLHAAPLDRAFVNDGGDIAVYAAPGQALTLGLVAHPDPSRGVAYDGALRLPGGSGIGGVATSGRHGRSFSLGIADAVTVLATDAATADAAATLVANAVDLDSPSIFRVPARDLDPDSDLGARLVTTEVGPLAEAEVVSALDGGLARAEDYITRGLICAAALRLVGRARVTLGLERLAA
ncbi:UPF0280 family protein [Roseomonas sp. CCTCC AB2023176]|uniref:UPF0280 family protein n=1 Tax=Roseomonas sp. CCTCC AB2023176 TaxID=3342640 RepID=UPI0035D9D0AE